jgi:hypothetical protein
MNQNSGSAAAGLSKLAWTACVPVCAYHDCVCLSHSSACPADCAAAAHFTNCRYDVTACPTKVVPGTYGFVAQLNEGRYSKKRPTEFRVDQVVQVRGRRQGQKSGVA